MYYTKVQQKHFCMPKRFACFLGFLIMTLSSCYKTSPTSLRVEVKTELGSAVAGAIVEVKGVPPENVDGNLIIVDYEEATNGNGIAFFNLDDIYKPGQSGVAIVEVKAQKLGLVAEETVNLIEEIDNRVDLVLQ
jgi:hypothetical protein